MFVSRSWRNVCQKIERTYLRRDDGAERQNEPCEVGVLILVDPSIDKELQHTTETYKLQGKCPLRIPKPTHLSGCAKPTPRLLPTWQ
jgi:hypothetical protein